MDGGESTDNYASRMRTESEGEFAGWHWYPDGDPFETLAGPLYWKKDADGQAICGFRAQTKHMNGGGFMHGGCVMTFADFCLFAIANDVLRESHSVTATFNGEFVGTARPGDLVEGRGEVVKAGRSMVFVRGIISNATNGEPMMSFSAVLKKTGPRA